MREKLFRLIEPGAEQSMYGKIYDVTMIIVICLSLVPLLFKEQTAVLIWLDRITVSVFILDYLLRWGTADYYFRAKGATSFLRYPFSPMAILDILTILPSFTFLYSGMKTVRVLRLIQALKVFRVFRSFRYFTHLSMLERVLYKKRGALLTVILLALGYIVVTAMLMLQTEPEIFDDFIDAIYWSTVSLSTTGYGDIVPVTAVGKIITTISTLFGMLIIAIPAGIITAGYVEETKLNQTEEKENTEHKEQ
ncbi:MAG: ion transporter [Clostridia bacterium]|nr:ion transporter [Clostridia bacterium]